MKLIFSIILFSQMLLASFSENQVRYFSGPEIQWYLYQLGIRTDLQECNSLRGNEVSSLGVNSPATGSPSSGGPTISTVGVIAKCVERHFLLLSGLSGQVKIQGLLIGENQVKELNQKYQNYWYSMSWSQVELNLRKRIVDHLVLHILGPDSVIEDYNQVKSAQELKNELATKVKKIESQTVAKVLTQMTLSLILRDESLSY